MVRGSGASGKSAKRRQWRKKRADFEEVPRLAATTVAGNRLARRWATAAPYLRTVTWGTVQRATARVAPTDVLQGARWGGPMPTSAPTHHLAIEFRRGGALPRPRATARVAPTEWYCRVEQPKFSHVCQKMAVKTRSMAFAADRALFF